MHPPLQLNEFRIQHREERKKSSPIESRRLPFNQFRIQIKRKTKYKMRLKNKFVEQTNLAMARRKRHTACVIQHFNIHFFSV